MPTAHRNGETWLDTAGRPIQAHGGGVMFHADHYYWYGEDRATRPHDRHGHEAPVNAGVRCYKSADLLAWEDLGTVLPVGPVDPGHELHPTRVIERPKVVYNEKTKKFVMWLHLDSRNYAAARAGVAVADDPAGPFTYLQSYRPDGGMSRDQTLFVDDDGTAYHVGSSDENATALFSVLTDDYLKPSGVHARKFVNRQMEAFAFTRRGDTYHMIASGCTGWAPNPARSASATDFMGDWTEHGNPCRGEGAAITFHAQSCFILRPPKAGHPHLAMFDVWRPRDLKTSGYVWLPIVWEDGQMTIPWRPTFDAEALA